MLFRVIEIVNESTLRVTPKWKWSEQISDLVTINAQRDLANLFEKDVILRKLKNELLNKDIELLNPLRVSDDKLLCDIVLNGQKIVV